MVWSTPLKMNMEPKSLKKTGEFRVQHVYFRGCSDLHPAMVVSGMVATHE